MRTIANTRPGKIFAVLWTEWHVECPNCGNAACVLEMGRAETVKQAERIIGAEGPNDAEGWRRIKGLWICPSYQSEATAAANTGATA